MSTSDYVKAAVIQKLSALSNFHKVYSYEKPNPDGFPAAFVTFSGNENEFFSTAENKRIYMYRILILCQIGQSRDNLNQLEKAEQQIQDLVGQAIDAFDSDITLGGNAQVVFIEAAVGEPGYVEYEGGWARSAEINLRIHSLYLV